MKCWSGWSTSWNQECWEKYQQHQTCRWYHSNSRKWRGTKEPLGESERGEWKAGLKSWFELKVKKMKIMASGLITSWWIEGEKVEAVTDFTFLGSKSLWTVTAVTMKLKGACSLEGKLWQKSSETSLCRQKSIIVIVTVFPVVVYGHGSWTIKKAERWRIDAVNLWCWRGLLRVLWTPRR